MGVEGIQLYLDGMIESITPPGVCLTDLSFMRRANISFSMVPDVYQTALSSRFSLVLFAGMKGMGQFAEKFKRYGDVIHYYKLTNGYSWDTKNPDQKVVCAVENFYDFDDEKLANVTKQMRMTEETNWVMLVPTWPTIMCPHILFDLTVRQQVPVFLLDPASVPKEDL